MRCTLLLLCLGVLLQAQVNAPRVGFIRSSDATIRPVYGLSDSFILGQPVLRSAVAASFSHAGGIVAAAGQIQILGSDGSLIAEYPAAESQPLVHIDDQLSTAIAWLPSSGVILHWNGESFATTAVSAPLPENVSSIRVSGANANLLVTAGGAVSELTIALDSGNIVSEHLLADVKSPAVYYQRFVLYADKKDLQIEAADGSLRTVHLPASGVSIEPAGAEWLQVVSTDGHQNWLLHLTSTAIELSELPAPATAPHRPSAAVLIEGEK
ncbi:MAG: hypothetical protein JOZ62_11565 [Acidobacteriaceae bacterium]|nr:hypothetical protein [Acidobacteriaceae bacterium]